jgi:two-component system, cell cycle sensor histidine kinase and response regulator CckA
MWNRRTCIWMEEPNWLSVLPGTAFCTVRDVLKLARGEPHNIDVLVTDVVLPGLRGPDLAKEVQAFHPEVHIIYISGYAQNLTEAQVPRGAAFLQKPFCLASLGEQLKLVPRRA